MSVKGLNNVLSELRANAKEAEQLIAGITMVTAQKMEEKAKIMAPANFGKLGQSINSFKVTETSYKVVAGAPYAAYVEFGTGGLVSVPAELKDIAITWKGKGIKKVNLRPRPYMYPSLLFGRNLYLETLKKALKKYGNVKS
jgi:hypothetical protein